VEDVELGARPRTMQVRDVKWSAPDAEDDFHRQDLQSQVVSLLRKLSMTQKVLLGLCALLCAVWFISSSSEGSTNTPVGTGGLHQRPRQRQPSQVRHSWDGVQRGTVLEVIRDGPLLPVDERGPVLGEEPIGKVILGHLVEAAAPPVKDEGHTIIMLATGGAVEASLVKIADPEDAALYQSRPAEEEQVEHVYEPAIQQGTMLQVVQRGPLLAVDKHGPVWGMEAGEVLPGQILHAAGVPVTEDGHTTVLLQGGGAIDLSLVHVADVVAGEQGGEELHEEGIPHDELGHPQDEEHPTWQEPVFQNEHASFEHEPQGLENEPPGFENEPQGFEHEPGGFENEPPSPEEMAEAAGRWHHDDPGEWEHPDHAMDHAVRHPDQSMHDVGERMPEYPGSPHEGNEGVLPEGMEEPEGPEGFERPEGVEGPEQDATGQAHRVDSQQEPGWEGSPQEGQEGGLQDGHIGR